MLSFIKVQNLKTDNDFKLENTSLFLNFFL